MAFLSATTGDRFELASPIFGSTASGPVSLFAWLNSSDWTLETDLFGTTQVGAPGNRVYVGYQSDEVKATYKGGTVTAKGGKGTPTDDTWHACGALFNSRTSRFAYLDGVAGAENTNDTVTDAANMTVSRAGFTYFDHDARYAECAAWDVALTTAEFGILAKGYSPLFVRPQNLVSYLPLIRDAKDLIRGVTWSTVGSPSVYPHPRIIYPHRRRIFTFPAAAVGGANLMAAIYHQRHHNMAL